MKQKKEFPPNIEKIRAVFPITSRTVFTYGDVIYNPNDGFIDLPLEEHEKTHSIQQKHYGIEEWWDEYIKNPVFRFEQELEAYRNQYRKAKSINSDRNKLYKYSRELAGDLSGSLYGNCISFNEAIKFITK